MRKYFVSSLLAAVLIAVAFVNTPSAHAMATSTTIPISNIIASIENPCANGEDVVLSGNLHLASALTFDNSGGFHATLQANPQGVTGVGETTGTKYQITGGSLTLALNLYGRVGETFTFADNFNIVGPGPDNNSLLHTLLHFTINPDGTVTAAFFNVSIECK